METKFNLRARVMKYAHRLLSTTKKSWRHCLLKAWELYRLARRMRSGEVKFTYEKANGSTRYVIGTLKNVSAGATNKGKHMTKLSYKTPSYLDVDKQEFRSFKIENLVVMY